MHQCAVVEVVVVNEVNVRPPAAILVVDKRRNMTRSLPQFFSFPWQHFSKIHDSVEPSSTA
jgi:hypothetical protein